MSSQIKMSGNGIVYIDIKVTHIIFGYDAVIIKDHIRYALKLIIDYYFFMDNHLTICYKLARG